MKLQCQHEGTPAVLDFKTAKVALFPAAVRFITHEEYGVVAVIDKDRNHLEFRWADIEKFPDLLRGYPGIAKPLSSVELDRMTAWADETLRQL